MGPEPLDRLAQLTEKRQPHFLCGFLSSKKFDSSFIFPLIKSRERVPLRMSAYNEFMDQT